MASSRVPTSAHQPPIINRLCTEWRHLTIRSAELRLARGWGLPGDEIRSLDDVLERCGYVAPPGPGGHAGRHVDEPAGHDSDHDSYLLRVLMIARTEPLAARIVLQRILPSLSALARRHAPCHQRQLEVFDELVANAWAPIRAYPTERRPSRIVPNLVRDIGFETIIRPARRRSAAEMPTAHDRLDEPEHLVCNEPLEELVALLWSAREAGFAQDDIDLICQLVTHERPENVALLRHVTPRTVRNHRDAIVHRLRGMVAVAIAA